MQINLKHNHRHGESPSRDRVPNRHPQMGSVRKALLLTIGVVVLVAVVIARRTPSVSMGSTFVVRRDDLPITVVEAASIEALESQELRSEVKGYEGTKILSIIEEGYLVTEEDVKNRKILVELDSSQLKQRITTQEIEIETSIAALADAQQSHGIQLNQNQSDIKAGEQKVRFARLDLEKFIGTEVASEIINALDREIKTRQTDTNQNSTPIPSVPIDFSKYAKVELLGNGEAKQKLRKFDDDLLVAKSEFGLAKNLFEGTQRLSEKGFVTRSTLENEQLNVKKNDLKVQTAETARELFLRYEFPKTAEELFSKYEEAFRLLDRTTKEAVSKITQSTAKLKSSQGRYRIMDEQRTTLLDQLGKCTIRALKTGLVVYGATGDNNYYNNEPIREGANVRERQTIITIPDMKLMSAKSKIHESQIKKVRKGMKVLIRLDAFPDEKLSGEVLKVGVLPDSQNRWMNPELKVYITSIKIDGTHEWLKPGMSAKIEILADQLNNVVFCPIQAVSFVNNHHVVNLINGSVSEQRVVEVGQFNDEFIHIKSGLKEGDIVALRAPDVPPDSDPKKVDELKTEPAATKVSQVKN